MANTISSYGLSLIKRFESCMLSAYRDKVGVVTIGYGWTKSIDGKPLTMGMTITQAKAESLLKEGLKSYEANVNKYDSKYHWNQNQFDALVSFAYNIGNIDGLTANGTRPISQIADKILAYNKGNGQVIPGLTERRKEERKLFLTLVSSISNVSTSPNALYGYTDFVKEVQSAIGAKVDGIAGTETLSKTVTISMTKNNKHTVVKPIQKYFNVLGFECGTVDGISGKKFDSATKSFQKANGCVMDGEITAKGKTWKKLLKIT